MKKKKVSTLIVLLVIASCITSCGDSSTAESSKIDISSSAVDNSSILDSSSKSETESTTASSSESETVTTTSDTSGETTSLTTTTEQTTTTTTTETTTTTKSTTTTTKATTSTTTTKAPVKPASPSIPTPSGSIIVQGQCGAKAQYKQYSNGCLVISGSGKTYDFFDFFGDYKEPGWCTANVSKIKYIIVKSGITGIGDNTFLGCINVVSVSLPNTITEIGEGAFQNCDSISSITIPNSVKRIGLDALGYYGGQQHLKKQGFTITGKTGSAAQKYAQQNGFKFIAN